MGGLVVGSPVPLALASYTVAGRTPVGVLPATWSPCALWLEAARNRRQRAKRKLHPGDEKCASQAR